MSETKPFLVPLAYHPFHGQSTYTVVCSNCGEIFLIYVWSFHACGKKCPVCKHHYSRMDVRKLEPVKVKLDSGEDKWAYSVGKWIFMLVNDRWIKVEREKETTT